MADEEVKTEDDEEPEEEMKIVDYDEAEEEVKTEDDEEDDDGDREDDDGDREDDDGDRDDDEDESDDDISIGSNISFEEDDEEPEEIDRKVTIAEEDKLLKKNEDISLKADKSSSFDFSSDDSKLLR